MAKGKKSFVLYADYDELFYELSCEDAGKLIKHIFKYVNDENPISNDPIVKISFIPIKKQLKRDLIKWGKKKKQWSDAGKASAEKRRLERIKANQRTLTDVESRSTDSTVNVNATVNVNVNVNDINRIYSLYPSKCPIKNSSTGKSSKHKDKIKTILKTTSIDELEKIINRYILECTNDKTWVKNFGTFLNNIPDYSEDTESYGPGQMFKVFYEGRGDAFTQDQDKIDQFVKNDNVIISQKPCKN